MHYTVAYRCYCFRVFLCGYFSYFTANITSIVCWYVLFNDIRNGYHYNKNIQMNRILSKEHFPFTLAILLLIIANGCFVYNILATGHYLFYGASIQSIGFVLCGTIAFYLLVIRQNSELVK